MKSNFKKSILPAIIAWMVLTATTTSQAPPVTSVGSASFSAGAFSVPVTVSGFQNVGSISLTLLYDNTKLSYAGASVNSGLITASPVVTPVTDQSGFFRLSATSVSAMTLGSPANTIVTLSFTAKPGSEGAHTLLTWSNAQGDCDITPPFPAVFIPAITTANMSTYFINGFIDIPAASKALNLTLFLEGLYSGGSTMRKAQGSAGDQFPLNTADLISVELHDAVLYTVIPYSSAGIDLSTTGIASLNVPSTFNGSYYLTIRHRNGIATVSASPVSFAGSTVSYNFTTQSTQVFGGNARNIGGVFAIFAGDVDQDGFVGNSDMGFIDNQSAAFASGYLPEDIDGDGFVGVSDMIIVDNNSAAFISAITP